LSVRVRISWPSDKLTAIHTHLERARRRRHEAVNASAAAATKEGAAGVRSTDTLQLMPPEGFASL
jgi:hypothetical protein